MNYVKNYRRILAGTLVFATINQVFSLLDPQIFRIIVDKYVNRIATLSSHDFLQGITLLLLGSVGVEFVSRVANIFLYYYLNVSVQKVRSSMYSLSVEIYFSLTYTEFTHRRRGEL